jgi:hypothetical protein
MAASPIKSEHVRFGVRITVAVPGSYVIRNTRHVLLGPLTVIYRYGSPSLQLQWLPGNRRRAGGRSQFCQFF